MDTKVPLYEHDCGSCTFLGRMAHPGLLADGTRRLYNLDLYVCVSVCTTYIARFSSDGPDYASAPTFLLSQLAVGPESTYSPGLVEAHRRHYEGLLDSEAQHA